MAKSTITSKGQTTVPREIRARLSVGAGDTLEWEVVGSVVRVTAASPAFLRRRGTLKVGAGSPVDDVQDARRRRGVETS